MTITSPPSAPQLPRGIVSRFAHLILGCGVAVALYLAPFLGAQQIPAFQPLVSIFSEDDRGLLIPTSSILVGLIALAIQFYAGETISRRKIRRIFGFLIVSLCLGLLILPLVHVRQVKKFKNPQLGTVEGVVIGWRRLSDCSCTSRSNQDCLGEILLDVEQCWDADSIFSVKATLFLLYLLGVQGFAGLAGLIALQRAHIARRRKPRPAAPAVAEQGPPAEAAPEAHPTTPPASRRPSRRKSPSAPPKS